MSETLSDICRCGTALINAPGIGYFCPNQDCPILDGPFDGSPQLSLFDMMKDQPPHPLIVDEVAGIYAVHRWRLAPRMEGPLAGHGGKYLQEARSAATGILEYFRSRKML